MGTKNLIKTNRRKYLIKQVIQKLSFCLCYELVEPVNHGKATAMPLRAMS